MTQIELQNASASATVPPFAQFEGWVSALLGNQNHELVIRVVDEDESANLNRTFRHKSGATNVLSFPFEPPPGIDSDILGDLVICAPVVSREAAEQTKSPEAHWAHMVIHGVLHLLGYDHLEDKDAQEMEAKEVTVLQQLGFPNPYEDTEA